jgi:hypothetical protein
MTSTLAAPPKQFKISPKSAFALDDEPIQVIRSGGAAPHDARTSAPRPFLPAATPQARTPVAPPPLPQQAMTPARTPEPVAAPAAAPGPIRQLALRAIFGIDRELSAGELLERARHLAGVRNLARVAEDDAELIEAARRALDGIGFANARLVCGDRPVEFIREGTVILAVQTEHGFAPGVRETLILVARELAHA